MDLAKSLHKMKPNDPVVSLSLGRLAYQTGDYQWAFSLLQESATAQGGKSRRPSRTWQMRFTVFGKESDAVEAMNQALKADLSGACIKPKPKRFLDMIAFRVIHPRRLPPSSRVEQALQSNSGYVPALMARGAIDEAKGDSGASIQEYAKACSENSRFLARHRRRLALSSTSGDPGKELENLRIGRWQRS